jgi:hypothetical protein
MTKSKIILKKIKKILGRIGYTTAGELELDHSPCYGSLGEKVVALVEEFGLGNFQVVVYCDENEIDCFEADYKDMENHVDEFDLEYLLEALEKYEKEMEE